MWPSLAWMLAITICAEPDVTMEGQPGDKWRDAVAVVCADLGALKDRDPTATVRLVAAGDDLVVEVTLADGRTALRRVREPLALRRVLEALLSLPPTPTPTPTPTQPAPADLAKPPPEVHENESGSTAPVLSGDRQPPPPPVAERPTPPPVARTTPTAELSVSTAGRAGGGAWSVAPTAEASLLFGHWQLGLSARWDVVQHMNARRAEDFEMESLAVGLAVARRIDLGRVDLDVGFSPRLVVETQSHEIDDDDETESATDVRAAAFGRFSFGRGALRPFLAVDAELSPARVRRKIHLAPELPPLPPWSAGLALGLTWSSP
ncbi:MAG: hypothetical protein KIT84_30800 [Labilithrix sp.]|nr:hypothetical protein [Labilithrix sp.]MCW5815457.1 hypothetical protein [Labilithrix sp.]